MAVNENTTPPGYGSDQEKNAGKQHAGVTTDAGHPAFQDDLGALNKGSVHRKLKSRHIQLIGIGGTIGTALYVRSAPVPHSSSVLCDAIRVVFGSSPSCDGISARAVNQLRRETVLYLSLYVCAPESKVSPSCSLRNRLCSCVS